jgi:hypothetical protein
MQRVSPSRPQLAQAIAITLENGEEPPGGSQGPVTHRAKRLRSPTPVCRRQRLHVVDAVRDDLRYEIPWMRTGFGGGARAAGTSGDGELVAFRVRHGDPRVWALAAVPQLCGFAGDQPGDNLGPYETESSWQTPP